MCLLDSLPSECSTGVKEYIMSVGGFLQDKVNINTNCLIHGSKKKTNNYKRAYELMQKGQDVQIVDVNDFIKFVDLPIENKELV